MLAEVKCIKGVTVNKVFIFRLRLRTHKYCIFLT